MVSPFYFYLCAFQVVNDPENCAKATVPPGHNQNNENGDGIIWLWNGGISGQRDEEFHWR